MTDYNYSPDSSTTLRRSDDQRIFAGVCGGLGEHFGVNAWWFRWAFIILAFFGFAGIAIYIASWLLIPDEDSTESIAGGWFDGLDMSDTGTLFGVVLIGVAALIIATSVFHISGAIVIAVALGIIGFLLYRGDIRPPAKTQPTVDEMIEVKEVEESADGTPAGTTAAVVTTSVATKPQRTHRPPKEKKPRPPKSMLGRLTMSVMLIVLSSMALIELADITRIEPYEYAAAAMGVVAVGLLVGAWVGRAYWLIFIGVLIAPVLFFSSLLPSIADWSAGDPRYMPTSADEVAESYDLGAGQMTIDLTQLSADELSKVGEIDASVSLGQLIVRLPSNVGATVNAEVGVGEVTGGEIFESVLVDVYQYSGVNVEQVFTVGPPPNDLLLNLEVGAGEISIQYIGELELGVSESKG
ncbi:MAG: PspC domain-containing protein [Actinomycetia bacterium]|nr:PspC domain-containing protein [Actinomycetes bacterium]